MKSTIFFIAIFLSKSLLGQVIEKKQKKGNECTIYTVEIKKNASGTINVGDRYILNCKPCYLGEIDSLKNIFIKYNINDVANILPKENNLYSEIKGKEQITISTKIIQSIKETQQNDCNSNIILDALSKKTPYTVYINATKDIALMEMSIDSNNFKNYGIEFRDAASNGIIRIKRFGRYYYLKADESPLVSIGQDAERFDFATRFNRGVATVGKLGQQMTYQLIDTTGRKSSFKFYQMKENFGNNSHLFCLKEKNGQMFLANTKMQLLSYSCDSIAPLRGSTYAKIKSQNGPKKGQNKGYEYYQTFRGNLRGMLKIDTNGRLIDSLSTSFQFLNFWTNNIIYAKDETTDEEHRYQFIDAEEKFENIYSWKSEIYYVDSLHSGFEFAIENPKYDTLYTSLRKNTHGAFIAHSRKIISPKYYLIGDLDSFGFIWVRTKNVHTGAFSESLIDENEKSLLEYRSISYPDYKGYIRICNSKDCWGFVNIKGHTLVKPVFDYITKYGPYGLAWAETKDKKCGLINRKGDFTDHTDIVNSIEYFDRIKSEWHVYDNEFNDYGVSTTLGFKENTFYKKYGIINYRQKVLLRNSYKELFTLNSGIKNVVLVTDSDKLFIYIKDGEIFVDSNLNVIRPYINGFAVANCNEGGICLVDSTGHRHSECMPFDSLKNVIDGRYVIAVGGKYSGIVKMSTGEKILDLKFDKISVKKSTIVCTKGTKYFIVSAAIENDVLKFLGGDLMFYNTEVKRYSKSTQ